MKILITGSSSVGKSTVIGELAKRGFTAIDSDAVPGLARLEIKDTGEPVDWPKGFVDWSYYSWNWQESVLKEVLAKNGTVFIGALNGNQDKYYQLFDKIIVLTITPEEHLRRMHARPKRLAGDAEGNIQDRIKKYPILLQRFLDAGALPVDSSGPPAQTADKILKAIGLASHNG